MMKMMKLLLNQIRIINKNNVGYMLLLLLSLILSQIKIFNYLFDTVLGRAITIVIILYLSYCNKILGIVGVLFIIIAFNYFKKYNEGFINKVNKNSYNDNNGNDNGNDIDNENISNNDIMDDDNDDDNYEYDNNANTTSIEGFDILTTERNMIGKDSNQFKINESTRNFENVLPNDQSVSNYSTV